MTTTTQTATQPTRRQSPVIALVPIAAAAVLVWLVGDMRTPAVVVLAVAIAALITTTFGRRPASTAAAGIASAVAAIGVGVLEAIALNSAGPAFDAAFFMFVAGVALALVNVDEQPTTDAS